MRCNDNNDDDLYKKLISEDEFPPLVLNKSFETKIKLWRELLPKTSQAHGKILIVGTAGDMDDLHKLKTVFEHPEKIEIIEYKDLSSYKEAYEGSSTNAQKIDESAIMPSTLTHNINLKPIYSIPEGKKKKGHERPFKFHK